MQTVKVEIPETKSWNYPIYIGQDMLNNAGNHIKNHTKAKKLLVVSNKKVFSLYGKNVKKSLEKEGFEASVLLIGDGEKHKNIKTLETIWTKAIELKLERKDAIVALGGGVVGDITGFAAATYLRGVDFIQIPTTLLAQVDSSIGGKVAINHQLGKNLIGNFYQPKAVLTDTNTLKTLPERELNVGLAEVLKYGFIEITCGLARNASSFLYYLEVNRDSISSLEPGIMEELVKYCCKLKASVVNKDEKEAGLRAILNFGHTIGHAVEKCYKYKGINHGEAVAIGIRGAFHIAAEKNLINEEYYQRAIKLLDTYGMDYKIKRSVKPKDLYKAMQVDKKVLAGKVRFILPVNESEVGIFDDVSREEILNAVKKLY